MFRFQLAVFALFAVSLRAAAADQVALPLTVQDGLEHTWTVHGDGSLTGVKPYATASTLNIEGTAFPARQTASRTIHEDGVELQIGPQVVGPVHVTRKIFFGKGEGHVRVLEIIENRSTTAATIRLGLQSDVMKAESVWDTDSGVITSGEGGVAADLCFGDGGGSRPTRDKRNPDPIHSWDTLALQPQSSVAILHFYAVRATREQALQFVQAFEAAPACRAIEPRDLAGIVNYDPRTLGAKSGVEILRGDQSDILLLKSGDKLTGSVQNSTLRLQTSYAQLEFPLPDIATLIYEGGANNIERIVVLNGDVFSGFILDPEITVVLEAGPTAKIRKEKISTLGFRIRANERDEYPVVHDITLTNGDHFSGVVKNETLRIGAAFGDMTVAIDEIAKIEFISMKGTVTELTLKNGDKISGFLKDEDISIDLDFGREVDIYQDRIEKIIFDRTALEHIAGEAAHRDEESTSR